MGTIKDKNRQSQAYNYFISLGYSPQASAGIVGNLDYESGLSTTAEGDKGFKGGSSFGIAQFREERLDRLKSRYGKDWTSFENQLDYVRHELETTHKRANNILKTTNNVYEAGQAFSDLYEVPAKKYKDNKDRQNKVNSIYSNYSKGTTNVTNLQEIDYTPIFAQQEVIYTPNIEEEKEDKEIEELTKENQEREFVKEYKASIVQQELPQLQEQFQEQAQPQYNLTDIYNQVSQFVDTPVAQRGGTYSNLREDEKNNEKPMLERIPSNRFEIQGGQTSAQLRSEKELEEEVGTYEEAMRGMMKSKIGFNNTFGNPATQRMSQAMPKTGMTPEGMGTHYMSSVDNFARPQLQDIGGEQLEYSENFGRSKEDIKFDREEDAQYFAKNYKEVAPMTQMYGQYNNFQQGGTIADNERAFLQEMQSGGVIKDQQGQRKYPNQITEIQGNTMATDGYGDIPLWTVPDVGEPRMIYPNTGEHMFPGATKFTEYPQFQVGGEMPFDGKSNYSLSKLMFPQGELDFEQILRKNPNLNNNQGMIVDNTFVSPSNLLDEVVIQRLEREPAKKFSYERDNSEILPQTVKDGIPTIQTPDLKKEERYTEDKNKKISDVKKDRESTIKDRSDDLDLQEIGDTIKLDTIKSTDNVLEVQKKLSSLGYNLNPNKKFSNDGIDGKMGPVTKAAIEEYNKKGEAGVYTSYKTKEGRLGACTETQCSEFAQNEVFRNMKPNVSREEWNNLTGITGDAWKVGNNIVKAGGKKVGQNELKAGDAVTMHTGGGSPYMNQAKAAGTDATHVGIVDKVNPDGSYYVLHNSHENDGVDKKGNKKYKGVEYRNLVKDGKVSGHIYTVRDAYRPNYGAVKDYEKKTKVRDNTSLVVDPTRVKELQKLDNSYFGTNMQEEVKSFSTSLNSIPNKKIMTSKHGLGEDEYQSLAKATLGVLAQESKFGTSKRYLPKMVAATASKTINESLLGKAIEAATGRDYFKNDEVSVGAGQVKYSTNYGNSDLTEFGINKSNFSKESNIGLVVLDRLSSHYKGLLNKGVAKKDAMYQSIEKYNKGRVTEYGKELDSDYASKVINFASMFTVKDDKDKKYNTILDGLATNNKIIKKAVN